jgi:hypothetical protein
MSIRNGSSIALFVSTILLVAPALTLARGGGGHSGGGGARFGGGGGHFAGGGFHGGWGGYGYGRGYYGPGWGRGYGWGGYPYYGYGVGLGIGLGVGYGLSAGYGYGGYGYYPGYGYYGYYPYGASSNVYYAPTYSTYVNNPPDTPATQSAATETAPPQAAIGMAASTREFAEKGEEAFKVGKYQDAIYAWRHAVVDDPQNGLLTMMLSQALFASGKYEEAAGATQAAMHLLPKDQWGVVVTHYTQLYGRAHDYTNQLRALEKAVKAKGDEPAVRFLIGFHYAYLGFLERAIDELDDAIRLAPRDEMARQLRDELRAKRAKPAAVPPLPGISSGPTLQPTPDKPADE